MTEEDVSISGQHMFSKSVYRFLEENLSRCVSLDLSTNHIDEKCAYFLASHLEDAACKLEALCIMQCHLNFKASAIIFAAVGKSPLKELVADGNIIDREACVALAHSLEMNPPLKFLSLVGCQLTGACGTYLFQQLPKAKQLKHLRLDSNQLFDRVFSFFPRTLQLESISISDNRLWESGSRNFLLACLDNVELRSLDIGFNYVNLNQLTGFLTHLDRLCISGCKVSENNLAPFLQAVGNSRLSCLLIDGLSFQLPVYWGYKGDSVWQMKTHLPELIACIKQSNRLNDVRIGFVDLDGILHMREALSDLDRKVIVSVHDFGHTRNVWTMEFPRFKLLSPTNVWKWKHRYTNTICPLVGQVYELAKCDGKALDTLDFNSCMPNTDILSKVLPSFPAWHFSLLDLSGNNLRDSVLDVVTMFLQKDGTIIDVINLSDSSAPMFSLRDLFQVIRDHPEKCPVKLFIKFDGQETKELNLSPYAQVMGKILAQNMRLEELHLSGCITAADAKAMVTGLRGNTHLRILDLVSDLFDAYDSPDPEIDPPIQTVCDELIDELYNALFSDNPCVLSFFNYAMITELSLYHSPNIKKWPKIATQLLENGKR